MAANTTYAETMYVTDQQQNSIYAVSPAGVVTPFVTSGLDSPYYIAADSQGNLYVRNDVTVGNHSVETILEINGSSGSLSTYATGINNAYGLAFDSSGALYVANQGTNQILKIASSGATPTVFASVTDPGEMAFDASGNLLVLSNSSNNCTISKITPSGSVTNNYVTGFVGGPAMGYNSVDNIIYGTQWVRLGQEGEDGHGRLPPPPGAGANDLAAGAYEGDDVFVVVGKHGRFPF
jgi:hypothetical protein